MRSCKTAGFASLSAFLQALDRRLLAQRPAAAAPLGWRCFQIGVFLLAASAFFGGLFLLVALILGSRGRRPILAATTNRLLLLVAALLTAQIRGAGVVAGTCSTQIRYTSLLFTVFLLCL